MGWLSDEVKGRSFVDVARRLQRSAGWPRSESVKQSSLATYLGELDKGRKADWFTQRPPVLSALAAFLEWTEEDLRERIEEAVSAASTRPRDQLLLWDVDLKLDLHRDDLPPAFSEQVLDPGQWPKLWRAPSGSGRSLVGRWLEARGLARFIQAERWADVAGQLPANEAAFVELMSPEGLPPGHEGRVCVAVDRAPLQATPLWEPVQTPPVEEWLPQLVEWVGKRRPPGDGFDAAACEKWIRADILPQQLIDGFGAALGFIGLFAKYWKPIQRLAPADRWTKLAGFFLRMRATQLEQPYEPALVERIRALARALLTKADRPLHEARAWEEWLDLLAVPSDRTALEYLQELSQRHGLKVDAQQLRKAVEAVPPSEHETLRPLQKLQVLRQTQPGLHAIHPSWLLSTLLLHAADDLLDQPVEVWGNALVKGHGARQVMIRLCLRAFDGDLGPIQRMLERPRLESPAWVAALEAAFRALGLAMLGRAVPEELAQQVLAHQRRLIIQRGALPMPRFRYGEDSDYSPLRYGAWLLAAHVIVERLKLWSADLPVAFTLQRRDPKDVAEIAQALSQVWHTIEMVPALRPLLVRFYGDLLERTGPIPLSRGGIQPMQLPAYVLVRLEPEALSWSDLEHQRWTEMYPLLVELADERKVPRERVLRALWMAWLPSKKDDVNLLGWSTAWAQELWSSVPVEVIASGRIDARLADERFPYERLGDAQWAAVLARWPHLKQWHHGSGTNRPWRHMPAHFIQQAIAEDRIGRSEGMVLRQIWETAAPIVLGECQRLFQEAQWDRAMSLAAVSPPSATADLVAAMRRAPGWKDAPREPLIGWLHDRIENRAPGWEHAWGMLNELTGIAEAAAR